MHIFKHLWIKSDQADDASATVLSLRKQISSYPAWDGGGIRNDHDFAGTGNEIDRDIAENLAFRFRDVGVSRTEYLIDWPNGLCAESQRSYGLCATDLVNLGSAGEL